MTAPVPTADVIVNNVHLSAMRQVPLHHPSCKIFATSQTSTETEIRPADLEEKVFGQGRR
jgi:hypothetical protein